MSKPKISKNPRIIIDKNILSSYNEQNRIFGWLITGWKDWILNTQERPLNPVPFYSTQSRIEQSKSIVDEQIKVWY